MDDLEEIRKLIFAYSQRFDSGDLDGFCALFARGTLHLPGLTEPMTGPDAVRGFIEDRIIFYGGSPRTQHLVSGSIIEVEPSGERASAQSCITLLQGLPGQDIRPILLGRYLDTFERADGQWWFARRTGADGIVGDLSQHLRRGAVGSG